MTRTKPVVAIFGSARTKDNELAYKSARKAARKLVKAGFKVVTGGGPGIMEAANRGAYEACSDDACSLANSIYLSSEPNTNPYVNYNEDYQDFQ